MGAEGQRRGQGDLGAWRPRVGADLQGPQKLVAAFNACNVKEQVDGPGSDLRPVFCVGLDGVQHLLLIFVTADLVTEHVQDNPQGAGERDPQAQWRSSTRPPPSSHTPPLTL